MWATGWPDTGGLSVAGGGACPDALPMPNSTSAARCQGPKHQRFLRRKTLGSPVLWLGEAGCYTTGLLFFGRRSSCRKTLGFGDVEWVRRRQEKVGASSGVRSVACARRSDIARGNAIAVSAVAMRTAGPFVLCCALVCIAIAPPHSTSVLLSYRVFGGDFSGIGCPVRAARFLAVRRLGFVLDVTRSATRGPTGPPLVGPRPFQTAHSEPVG
jgi:hypothetical protein